MSSTPMKSLRRKPLSPKEASRTPFHGNTLTYFRRPPFPLEKHRIFLLSSNGASSSLLSTISTGNPPKSNLYIRTVSFGAGDNRRAAQQIYSRNTSIPFLTTPIFILLPHAFSNSPTLFSPSAPFPLSSLSPSSSSSIFSLCLSIRFSSHSTAD